MDHARFCRGVSCRCVPGINRVILGRAVRKRPLWQSSRRHCFHDFQGFDRHSCKGLGEGRTVAVGLSPAAHSLYRFEGTTERHMLPRQHLSLPLCEDGGAAKRGASMTPALRCATVLPCLTPLDGLRKKKDWPGLPGGPNAYTAHLQAGHKLWRAALPVFCQKRTGPRVSSMS